MKEKFKTLCKDSWYALTLLTGKVDERTVSDMNEEKMGFAMLTVATLASLFILFLGTALSIIFKFG